MNMKNYYVVLQDTITHPTTRHYRRLPSEITGNIDSRESLPWPRILIIENTEEGFFINRYNASGEKCGNTWHQNTDDVKHQISCEYGDLAGDFVVIPNALPDIKKYSLEKITNS